MTENVAGRLHRSIEETDPPWTVKALRDALDAFPPDAEVVVVAQADPNASRVFGYDIAGVSHRNLLPPSTAGVVFLVPYTGGGVELVPPARPQNTPPDGPPADPLPADHDTTSAAQAARKPGGQ